MLRCKPINCLSGRVLYSSVNCAVILLQVVDLDHQSEESEKKVAVKLKQEKILIWAASKL